MQLSLVSEMPELEKKIFLDIYAKVYFDTRRNRPRLKTLEGQTIPCDLKIGCPAKMISEFPEGTIYKLDARLIQKNGRRPYFLTINKNKVQRAIEFFDHNLQIQKGLKLEQKAKKIKFEKIKKVKEPNKVLEEISFF
ncbi:hypothetical protein VB796_00055 [Arcicella sp. LKC2W]|uniref:hypothetical protein n=1 Tax=Arcicella sp. LKC2W TaxID=2984198 RepID=UPI002B21D9B3|nr:hypothetical protein [Arcicella sp. LKC2W]MEA5457408.1 hypothetical protein [Arcicella sp. LKC2W]